MRKSLEYFKGVTRLKLKIVKEKMAGVAERPFKGEEYGIEDVEEPTILIGEEILKEGIEDLPPYQALAHEIYHASKSPRRRGPWPVVQSEPSVAGLEDEVEAIMFASLSTGNPPSNIEIKGAKMYARKVGIDSDSWRSLVREAASRMDWRGPLSSWYY